MPLNEARETEEAFRQFYTETNLRRVRWVLVLLVLDPLDYLFAYPALRRVDQPYIEPLYFVGMIVATLTMFLAVVWALRKETTPRARARVAGIYYVFGCLIAVARVWVYKDPSFYPISLLAFGVLLILPPRMALPLLLGGQTLFIAVLVSLPHHHSLAWSNTSQSTTYLLIAAIVSMIFYYFYRENFRKGQMIHRQVKALEKANAEMNDLMALTAHNLGSPLQGITNLLELVRIGIDEGRDRKEVDSALGSIARSCQRMNALVNRLLAAHSAEHAGTTARPMETDLVPCFREAVKRAAPLAEAKGIALALSLPSALPPAGAVRALVQPDLLEQVLDNLLSNAVKYAPYGTTVTVALTEKDGSCRGEIGDEGPGIGESERAHLFTKFFHGRNKPTGGETSTGLGLFIVQNLMKGMGGTAGYEPGNPKGSVFWIEMVGS